VWIDKRVAEIKPFVAIISTNSMRPRAMARNGMFSAQERGSGVRHKSESQFDGIAIERPSLNCAAIFGACRNSGTGDVSAGNVAICREWRQTVFRAIRGTDVYQLPKSLMIHLKIKAILKKPNRS
jgi:hypothetical protein